MEQDGWHVDYELNNPKLKGGGPNYTIGVLPYTIGVIPNCFGLVDSYGRQCLSRAHGHRPVPTVGEGFAEPMGKTVASNKISRSIVQLFSVISKGKRPSKGP